MKPWHFKVFEKILDEFKPKTIGEIGCHDGRSGVQMCNYVLKKFTQPITYTGYDAFDEISEEESYSQEINGKGLGSLDEAHRWMKKVKARNQGRFSYELIKGYTSETLTKPVKFDFVYIDAGHSYESVLHDWNMVKESKVVLFDDYHLEGVNKVLKEHVEKTHDVEYVPFEPDWSTNRATAIVRKRVK